MKREITHKEWVKQARKKFGDDLLNWKFVCPLCKHATTIRDWKSTGATEGEIAFSCIGRRKKLNPECNYAGGGLFALNPVVIRYPDNTVVQVFEFAE